MGLTFATPNGGNSEMTGNKNSNNNSSANNQTSNYSSGGGHPSAGSGGGNNGSGGYTPPKPTPKPTPRPAPPAPKAAAARPLPPGPKKPGARPAPPKPGANKGRRKFSIVCVFWSFDFEMCSKDFFVSSLIHYPQYNTITCSSTTGTRRQEGRTAPATRSKETRSSTWSTKTCCKERQT